MNDPKKKKKSALNLNEQPEGGAPVSQEDILLNLLGSLAGIAQAVEAVAIELQDIKDNDNRRLLNEGLISESEIEERENDDGKD